METVKLDYDSFLRQIRALRPDQAIFGETPHPRLLSEQADQPGYAQAYSLTSHSIKMGLCTAGTGIITLEGNSYRMETGDLCFVNRHVPNYESYFREKEPYTITWFLVSWWGQLMVHESVYDSFGEFTITNQQRIRITNALISTIEQVIKLGREHRQRNWEEIRTRLQRVFGHFSSHKVIIGPPLKSAWHKKLVNDIAKYLDDHYKEKLTLEQVAAKFKFSASHLDTLFKRGRGMGIIQHLILQRMLSAGTYLTKTTMRVNEIAEKLAYDDVYYFSKLFKRVYGCSPREYRDKFA